MLNTKTKTNIIVFLVLTYIMTAYSLKITSNFPLTSNGKYTIAILLGTILGALMICEVNEKPTTLIRVQLFTGYLGCYLIFMLAYTYFKRATYSDYMIIISTGIYIAALLTLFTAEKNWLKNSTNQPEMLTNARYIE